MENRSTALLADAAARAQRYLERIGDRAVVPSPEAVLALGDLDWSTTRSDVDRSIAAVLAAVR